ncbi:MAG: transporter ATP-binding protein [Herbinix sp.]|nr:transporter ATP-binding protein [Herbinix sp.]
MDEVLSVRHMVKHFGSVKAVDDISFTIKRGELFGFLGVNGAGKSTTINMLCTLYAAGGGSALVCGYELGKDNDEIRKRIGVVFQNNSLDDRLTVRQNLISRAYLYDTDHKRINNNLTMVCELLDIGALLPRMFKDLSGGQKRRCEIARAIMNQPEILFLDEPTTGLDPQTRKMVWHCIELLRKEQNMSIFLTTHYMEEAARAQHVAIIDSGKLVADSTPSALKEKYASDRIRVYAPDYEKVIELAKNHQLEYKMKSNHISIIIKDTLSSIPLLTEMKPFLSAFEVVQGTMDDVFINITGKQLKEE